VEDSVQINNTHIEITCSLDVLTTYKNQILETKAYVLYSDSAGRTDLIDNRNVKSVTWTYRGSVSEQPDIFKPSEGVYILQVINGHSNAKVSSVASYIIPPTQMDSLMAALYDDSDFFDNLIQYIQNPANFLVKCMWYPFSMSYLSDRGITADFDDNLYIGNYDTGIQAARISNKVTIHDLTEIRLRNLLYDNYQYDESNCVVKCNLPFFGVVDLPISTALKSGNRDFIIQYSLDLLTGTLLYEILGCKGEAVYTVKTYRTQLGVEVPLGLQTYNPLPLIGSVVSAGMNVGGSIAASVMMPAYTPFAIGNIGSNVGHLISSVSSLQRDNGVVGQLGSRVDIEKNTYISAVVLTADLAESITAKKEVLGLPCASTVELGTLSGYVQTHNASVSAIARKPIIDTINAYLDGGVYIE